jgi:hypothetical protein
MQSEHIQARSKTQQKRSTLRLLKNKSTKIHKEYKQQINKRNMAQEM